MLISSTGAKTGAAIVALLMAAPSLAQLSPPISPQGQQQQDGGEPGQRGGAEAQASLPQPETVPPFQPATIEAPPAASTRDEEERPAAQRRTPAQPAESEFETYVSNLTGKPLKRFGAELLVEGARDFTAAPTAAVPPDYRLNPGDELLLGLTGAVQASNLRFTIDNEGRIFVPKVGAITVGGLRYAEVRETIARRVSRQYRQFDLQVRVARLRGITVYVTGFARSPGSYSVNSLSTLVNAVLAAGGPSAGGSFRSIQLRRDGELVSDFDLYDLLLKGDKRGDAVLQNGDVIYIAPAGEQVAVVGSVNREAIFEVGPGETLHDAILYAGGASTVADRSRLFLFDSLGESDAGWQQLSPSEAQSRVAQRGNILQVLSNAGIARPLHQQSVLVTISGEVAKPGRYYFKPGTRLADVVVQAGGLTQDAFPYASVITRESVRQQQRVSFDRAVKDMELLLTTQPLLSVNRAQLVQPANLALIRSIVDQLHEREPTGRLVFDLPVTAKALPGDLILENNDTIHVPAQPVTVGVFGAVASPASFAYRPGTTIGAFIKAAGGVQQLGDKSEIFVVRANGRVLADGKGVLREEALPGDLIYVPVEANRGEFWARVRDVAGTLFGGLTGAAAIKAIAE